MRQNVLFKDDTETTWPHCVITVIFIAHAFVVVLIVWDHPVVLFHQMMAVMFLSQRVVSRIDRTQRTFGTQ